jgi:hypothetical protein
VAVTVSSAASATSVRAGDLLDLRIIATRDAEVGPRAIARGPTSAGVSYLLAWITALAMIGPVADPFRTRIV